MLQIRKARIEDVERIVQVEIKSWGVDSAATEEDIRRRINLFSDGNVVAIDPLDEKIIGYASFIKVSSEQISSEIYWDDITNVTSSHDKMGQHFYGVTLTGDPDFAALSLGKHFLAYARSVTISMDMKSFFLGSRIPGLLKWSKNGNSVSDYVWQTHKDLPRDPELRMYASAGFLPLRILPGYFTDPESLNNGVLVEFKNPFHQEPLVAAYLRELANSATLKPALA